MISHAYYTPHPALQEYVSNLMICRIVLDKSESLPVIQIPPLPEDGLYFYPYDPLTWHLDEGKSMYFQQTIIGPKKQKADVSFGYNNLTVKVGLKPGGLYRLLGIPMDEMLSNVAFDSCDFLGEEMSEINERLSTASSPEQMISIVEEYLLKKRDRLKQKLPFDRAVVYLMDNDGLVDIDKIASLACLSTRQLERLFKQRIGFPAKLFARLTRFAKAFMMKENNALLTWTKIAYACGYSDQMHLIREYKEFTSSTPTVITDYLDEVPFRLKHKYR